MESDGEARAVQHVRRISLHIILGPAASRQARASTSFHHALVVRSCCRTAHPDSRATARARPVPDCSSPERPVASARERLRRGVASALARRASRSLLLPLTYSTGRTAVGFSRLQAAIASDPLNWRCRARKCLIAFTIENLGQSRSLHREGIRGRTSEVADRKRAVTGACNHQPSEPVSFAAVRRAGASALACECLVACSCAHESCTVPDSTGQRLGLRPLPSGIASGRPHTGFMWSQIHRKCCTARALPSDSK